MTNPDFLARLPPEVQERARRAREQMRVAEQGLLERLRSLGAQVASVEDLTTGDLPSNVVSAVIAAAAVEEYDALRSRLAALIVDRGWCVAHFDEVLAVAIAADRRGDNPVPSTLAGGLVTAAWKRNAGGELLQRLQHVARDESLTILPIALTNEFTARGRQR